MTTGAKIVIGVGALAGGLLVLGYMNREEQLDYALEEEEPEPSDVAARAAADSSRLSTRLWEIHRRLQEQGR